jgi:hypothetical protein
MFHDIDLRPHEPERPDPRDARRDDRTSRDRSIEHDGVFVETLDLPRGSSRDRVHVREDSYDLRGSEVRVMGAVGAFRVIPAHDLMGDEHATRHVPDDLRHLREVGLIHTVPHVVGHQKTTLITLTDAGRSLLEAARRDQTPEGRQHFYAGLAKPRELAHDAVLYRAYLREAEAIRARGGEVRRVVLDYELKREYQTFLQASNRGRSDADGRPNRDEDAIEGWAADHQLPVIDNHVHFPDLRIEYDDRDGRRAYEDVEIMTPHYRGRHASSKARAGFRRYRATGARLGGGRSRGGGGVRITGQHSPRGARGRDVRLAEEFL